MRSIETTGEVRLDDGKFGFLQRSACHSPAPTRFPRHADAAGLPENVSRAKIDSKSQSIWRMWLRLARQGGVSTIFRSRLMKRLFLVICIFIFSAARVYAQGAPACTGVDLVERMRLSDPRAFAAFQKDSARIPNVDGLLWRIDKAGAPPSYLFGTMHVGDPDALALAHAAERPLRASRVVMTELGDMDRAKQVQAATPFIVRALRRGGGGLAAVRDPKDLAEVKKMLAAQGVDVERAEHMAPWTTILALAMPACERLRAAKNDLTVDGTVIAIARGAQISVVAIETVGEEVEVLSNMDETLLARSLVMMARRSATIDDRFTTTLRLYLSKRAGAIVPAMRYAEKLTPEENQTNATFMEKLADTRNATMVARVKPELDRGGAFVAVGAAHLPGSGGLVALLRKAGYQVTKVW